MHDNFTISALTISDVGLRLIKSYEGFRPVDIELVSGQRVVGYGHRVMDGQSMHLKRKAAERLLIEDLAPYEAMINDHIFAPLSQSQFDALCSLAFNIGPKKFLDSDVLHALNNGRVLDAANGFDVWRRGSINGQSYVVDALVRRRTAEKVLFLRPADKGVRAPRVELEANADEQMQALTTTAPERIYEGSRHEDSGHVSALPFSASLSGPLSAPFTERRDPNTDTPVRATPMRRRDDNPGGVLTLSETHDADYDDADYDEAGYDDADYDDTVMVEDYHPYEDALETDELEQAPELETLVLDDLVEIDGELDFDPDRDITPDYKINEPSPIASAAAEVSDRLDALMAETDEGPRDDNTVKTDLRDEGGKVLPFTRHDFLEGQPDEAPAEILTVTDEIDGKVEDKIASQKDSASRYIERNIAPIEKVSDNTGPLKAMIIGGMVMLGGSLGAIASGLDKRYGVAGEFASTVGVLFGLMLVLGSIYYVLKMMRNK